MIKYNITPDINKHIYYVTLQFKAKENKHFLALPNWIPGSYKIRDFSKNIITITAKQDKNIAITQITKNKWLLEGLKVGLSVEVTYEVYAHEYGIRSAFIDFNWGYFNNTSLCIAVVGLESLTHRIKINKLPKQWQIVTALDEAGINQFIAPTYDHLIDCPVEMGKFTYLSFKVESIPFTIAINGNIPLHFNDNKLISDVIKICKTEINLFAAPTPFKKYLFILNLHLDIYTGLEHLESTLLIAPYYSLPLKHHKKNTDDYIKLLGLISHEFFHAWNVKSIKPQAFEKYDLNSENYTSLLWFFEGITSYYDNLILYRAGIIDQNYYLNIIINSINKIYKYEAVNQQSLVDSSKLAWTKFYNPDENSVNAVVSYYEKGSLVGLCLDLLIRDKTKDKNSLDLVMRGLYNKFLQDKKGIKDTEIAALISKLAECNINKDIIQFISTTTMLPFTKLFKKFGLELVVQNNTTALHNGSLLLENQTIENKSINELGCVLAKQNLGYQITKIYAKTMAQDCGLAVNDLIVAINGTKLVDIDKQLQYYQTGDVITLTLFRNDDLLTLKTKLTQPNFNSYYLQIKAPRLLNKWL